jgi:hypothetical protein
VTLIGYFPKRVATRPGWLKAPNVREIASVSTCISAGPPDWLEQWRHNALGLFDSVSLAHLVVPQSSQDFEIFAYCLLGDGFLNGEQVAANLPDIQPETLPDDFAIIGYDAVSKSSSDFFECSPLSCNNGAAQFPTNELCLFATLEEAERGAREFSAGRWEPGTYYVVGVYRRRPEARDVLERRLA